MACREYGASAAVSAFVREGFTPVFAYTVDDGRVARGFVAARRRLGRA